MKILNEKLYDFFMKKCTEAENSINLCAPYVKKNIINDIFSKKSPHVKLNLITKFNAADFCGGASDIEALEQIAKHRCKLYNVSNLHAKIYIFDQKSAIITSANLTNGGMRINNEYGVYIDDENVKIIIQDYQKSASRTNEISARQLNEVKNFIDNLNVRRTIPPIHRYNQDEFDTILQISSSELSNALSGWKKDIFDLLNTLEGDIFKSDDYKNFIPELKQKHPENNRIEAKIRQILQQLRDLGLLKFEQRGIYKKLWKMED